VGFQVKQKRDLACSGFELHGCAVEYQNSTTISRTVRRWWHWGDAALLALSQNLTWRDGRRLGPSCAGFATGRN
jgi:hypothetical protein